MRAILLFLFIFHSGVVFAQSKYHAEYRETVSFEEADSIQKQFSSKPAEHPERKFIKTRNTKKLLRYLCREYVSSDGTCRISVAASLPSYINPGIKANKVKGAILSFEIKEMNYFMQSEISRLDQLSQAR